MAGSQAWPSVNAVQTVDQGSKMSEDPLIRQCLEAQRKLPILSGGHLENNRLIPTSPSYLSTIAPELPWFP